MHKSITISLILFVTVAANAQDRSIMEKRAREFVRMISVNDTDEMRKFVKENYTQAMIDRMPRMQDNIETGNGSRAKEKKKEETEKTVLSQDEKIEVKIQMFKRLHEDFATAKIKSSSFDGNKLAMVVTSESGLEGAFNFIFDTKDSRIDAIGIDVNQEVTR